MENLKIVEIVFEDHYSIGEEWYEEGTKHEPWVLTCAGYLVDQDDKYYYVVNTYEPKTKNYQAGTAILKSCVVDYLEYDRPQPKQSKRQSRFS